MPALGPPECACLVHSACKCTFQPAGLPLVCDISKIHELLLQSIQDENATEAAANL